MDRVIFILGGMVFVVETAFFGDARAFVKKKLKFFFLRILSLTAYARLFKAPPLQIYLNQAEELAPLGFSGLH